MSSSQEIVWNLLMEGKMLTAVYEMFNIAFLGNGLIVVILFLVYQFMLYQKTQNITLLWVMGLLFTVLYSASMFVQPFGAQILFLILILELAGIMFLWVMGK
jgi:hypothetical protein